MNVCLVSQEFPPHTNWGGVGVQFELLARGLARRGHRVTVVSRAAPGAPAHERISGYDVWRIGAPISRKRLMGRTLDRLLHAKAVAAKVAELDAGQRFDVIESVVASLDAGRLVADPRFAPRTVICCHGSNFMGQAVGGVLGPLHRLDWQWSGRREEVILHQAPTVVVSSAFTRRFVLDQGVDDRKIEVIPLGVDTERFRPHGAPMRDWTPTPAARRTETPRPFRVANAPLLVGFVGRLENVKGVDFAKRVVEALHGDPRVRFIFKGNIHPATRDDTLAFFARNAAVATHAPAGSHEEMPELFRSLDVLLLPSRVENFGLTYAEAMASGVLVFAGRDSAGAEIVTDGLTGFLVDPDGPPDAVVERLRTLAIDRQAFADVRRRGREYVEGHISLDSFIDAKERQYRRVSGQ